MVERLFHSLVFHVTRNDRYFKPTDGERRQWPGHQPGTRDADLRDLVAWNTCECTGSPLRLALDQADLAQPRPRGGA